MARVTGRGLRKPEHLVLSGEGIAARVRVVEPTGAETMVWLEVAGQDVAAVFHDRPDLAPGEEVRLAARADKAHLFDPGKGRRL